MKNILVITFCICLLATTAVSQGVLSTKDSSEASKRLLVLSLANSTKVIKNQPFSAEAVSESVQVLTDGNRITKSSTVKMFRDSEGRYRREPVNNKNANSRFTTNKSGLFSFYGIQGSISIFDPVDSVRYTLNPSNKTAQKYNINKKTTGIYEFFGDKTVSGQLKKVEIDESNKTAEGQYKLKVAEGQYKLAIIENEVSSMNKNVKSELLGTKVIEGVQAEGTRTVRTISAGVVGNELPIDVTYESWYSKELDLILYSLEYDPRYGEQIYRLVNLDRSEPDISLFSVPSDYKLVDAKLPTFTYTTKPK